VNDCEQTLRARQKLVSKLPVSGELLRGSLLERTVRHTKDCSKCARRPPSICSDELDEMRSRVRQVMKQTRARIFRHNTRSEGKLLSLFEPSTEVIRKGKAGKPNEFGKMVELQEAECDAAIRMEGDRPSG
jgi:hypothetical protein